MGKCEGDDGEGRIRKAYGQGRVEGVDARKIGLQLDGALEELERGVMLLLE